MRIRKASPEDAEILEGIFSSLCEPEKKWSRERILEKIGGIREFYLISEEDKQGAIELRFDGNQCELVAIATNPRGNGLGSQLIGFTEELARKKHCHQIWCYTLDENKATGFYKKMGWEKEDYLPDFWEDQGCYKFSKKLKNGKI